MMRSAKKRKLKYAPRVGMQARVLIGVRAYGDARPHEAPMLTPDITVTVAAIDVPAMRLSPCVICEREHQTFVLVEWPSQRPEMMKHGNSERAAVSACNLMEWVNV